LNWAVTALGYTTLEIMHGYLHTSSAILNGIKGCAGVLSVLQAGLVVGYWSRKLAYLEIMRRVMRPKASALPSLLHSPKDLTICVAESVIHLFVFIPETNFSSDFSIFDTDNGFSLDELSYVVILMRNYHTLRLMYWLSAFSSLHTATITHIVRSTYDIAFILRCFLVEYGLPLVLMAYGVIVLIPGVFVYMFEHEINTNQLGVIWNNFWVVFYTQTTIGYGEGPPQTFFGQLMIFVAAGVGYFNLGFINSISRGRAALSLREWTCYSELRYAKEKKRHSLEAVVLLQRWWRLMALRMRKTQSAEVIFAYFAQLHTYKNVLVACERVKDNRFERQIAAFGSSVRPRIRSLQEYLSPVVEDRSLLLDVYRSAYNTKMQCISLRKLTQKHALYALTRASKTTSSRRSSLAFETIRRPGKSNHSQVIAKKTALQNLKMRIAEKLSATITLKD